MPDPTQLAIPSCERQIPDPVVHGGGDLLGKDPLSQGSVLALAFGPDWSLLGGGPLRCGRFGASSVYPLVPPAPPLRCDGQKRLQTPPGGSVVMAENRCPEPVGSWNPAAPTPPFSTLGHWGTPSSTSAGGIPAQGRCQESSPEGSGSRDPEAP